MTNSFWNGAWLLVRKYINGKTTKNYTQFVNAFVAHECCCSPLLPLKQAKLADAAWKAVDHGKDKMVVSSVLSSRANAGECMTKSFIDPAPKFQADTKFLSDNNVLKMKYTVFLRPQSPVLWDQKKVWFVFEWGRGRGRGHTYVKALRSENKCKLVRWPGPCACVCVCVCGWSSNTNFQGAKVFISSSPVPKAFVLSTKCFHLQCDSYFEVSCKHYLVASNKRVSLLFGSWFRNPPKKEQELGKRFLKNLFQVRNGPIKRTEKCTDEKTPEHYPTMKWWWPPLWPSTQCIKWTRDASALYWRPERRPPAFLSRVVFLSFLIPALFLSFLCIRP